MKRNRNILFLLLVLVGLLLSPLATHAQTDTAPTNEPAATTEATPAPDTTPDIPVPVENGSLVLSTLEIVLGVVGIFSAGGIVGIAGAGVVAYRLRTNPSTIAAIEKLGNSVPDETAKQIIDMTSGFNKSVNELVLLVTEALDRQPAETKPPAQPPV